MTLRLWESDSQSNTYYWLIKNEGIIKAQNYLNNVFWLENAIPLLKDEAPFTEIVDISPCLVPLTTQLQALPDNILSLGLILESQKSVLEIVSHLRTLLIAGLDGESVFFRFYDPCVLTGISAQWDISKQQKFLGNIERIAMAHDNDHVYLSNSKATYFVAREDDEPWWVIDEKELQVVYDVKVHASVLMSRLWSMSPALLSKLSSPENTLNAGLTNAPTQLMSEDKELWVIAHLAHHADFSADKLFTTFKLNHTQYTFVKQIMESPQWLIA